MKNNEIIKRFKILSEYDVSKTSNENVSIISEQYSMVGDTKLSDLKQDAENTESISDNELNKSTRKIIRNLNPNLMLNARINLYDLKKVQNELEYLKNLNTEDGYDAIATLREKYKMMGRGDIIQDVTNIKVRTSKGIATKQTILNLLEPVDPYISPIGNKFRPIEPTIPSVEEVLQPEKPKSIYHNCYDFPFEYGCRNNAIKEIQTCLGIKQDGYYGPQTNKKLADNKIDMTNKVITREIYNIVKSRLCGGNEPISNIASNLKPTEPTISKTTPKIAAAGETPEATYNRLFKYLNKIGEKIKYMGETPLNYSEINNLSKYFASKGFEFDKTTKGGKTKWTA
jgi:hypothetical protein